MSGGAPSRRGLLAVAGEDKESRKIINSMGKHRWTGVAQKGRCELLQEEGGRSTVILAPESRLGGSVS